MIDRVARALFNATYGTPPSGNDALWADLWLKEREDFMRKARAAIGAMREPAEDMVDAGDDIDGHTVYDQAASAASHWRAMIDAAMGEK